MATSPSVTFGVSGDPMGNTPLAMTKSKPLSQVQNKTLQQEAFVLPHNTMAQQPISFVVTTTPCGVEGQQCNLDIAERFVVIAGSESAKLLSAELKRAFVLLNSKKESGTQISFDLSISPLLVDFARATMSNAGSGAFYGANKDPAKVGKKSTAKKPASKKKPTKANK